MKKLSLIILSFFFLLTTPLIAQDDLFDILDAEVEEEPEPVLATFKSTRVINGHSIERMWAKQLDVRINHRFGQVNSGGYELWGLDNALINFSFEYGVNDKIMLGIRRGTNKKVYDASIKWSILRQTRGVKVMPIALSYYGDWSFKTAKGLFDLPDLRDASWKEMTPRMAYTHQLLIGRKFSEKLSLQLSPTYVHRNMVLPGYTDPINLVVFPAEKNDILALGIGGRYKFHRRVALMWEFFYTNHVGDQRVRNADGKLVHKYQYPLSIGFDIETGGHVFQLFFTNSRPMVEDGFIGETTSRWADGGIYFGFNMSRVFAVGLGRP
jgi:hypothetical protein